MGKPNKKNYVILTNSDLPNITGGTVIGEAAGWLGAAYGKIVSDNPDLSGSVINH